MDKSENKSILAKYATHNGWNEVVDCSIICYAALVNLTSMKNEFATLSFSFVMGLMISTFA